MSIQIYDPPMCCSSGVCGATIDPRLTQFAADLRWLESQGCRVERYNLAQQPQAFVSNATVKENMTSRGIDCLPLTLIDGMIAKEGQYPSREELARLVAVQLPPLTDAAEVQQVQAAAASSRCGSELVELGGPNSKCC